MQTPSPPSLFYRMRRVVFHGQGWYGFVLVGALAVSLVLGGVTPASQGGDRSPSPISTEDLSQRIEALETANRVTNERLAMTERTLTVKSGEERASGLTSLREGRLALVLLQLRIASQTHSPFNSELALAHHLEQGETERLSAVLKVFDSYATTGVGTVSELRDSFGFILLPKLQPLLEEGDQTWGGWAFGWLNMAVAPFVPSFIKPTPQQQLVISATDRLTEDDLRGAVEQIAQLDGPAAAFVTRWMKEANARLAVDAAYNDLSGILVALLGRTPS